MNQTPTESPPSSRARPPAPPPARSSPHQPARFNIGHVAALAHAAGLKMGDARIGTRVADGAYAALVLERADAELTHSPAVTFARAHALCRAYLAAWAFLAGAGAIG